MPRRRRVRARMRVHACAGKELLLRAARLGARPRGRGASDDWYHDPRAASTQVRKRLWPLSVAACIRLRTPLRASRRSDQDRSSRSLLVPQARAYSSTALSAPTATMAERQYSHPVACAGVRVVWPQHAGDRTEEISVSVRRSRGGRLRRRSANWARPGAAARPFRPFRHSSPAHQSCVQLSLLLQRQHGGQRCRSAARGFCIQLVRLGRSLALWRQRSAVLHAREQNVPRVAALGSKSARTPMRSLAVHAAGDPWGRSALRNSHGCERHAQRQ